MKLFLIWCVLLALLFGANEHAVNAESHVVLCKSYCVKKYFECYQKHQCERTEKNYRIQFCKEQYDNCYTQCIEELRVLDYDPKPSKMKEKDREIFKRLRSQLGGSNHDFKPSNPTD
ncbi:hypothetical protein LSAT2_028322 [Lamellibrachia satsuma]|nr:hypothetical protein LSAT2_028322 [Lamellibrachia satsuma]